MGSKDCWSWCTTEKELETQDGGVAKKGMAEIKIMGKRRQTGSQGSKRLNYGMDRVYGYRSHPEL